MMVKKNHSSPSPWVRSRSVLSLDTCRANHAAGLPDPFCLDAQAVDERAARRALKYGSRVCDERRRADRERHRRTAAGPAGYQARRLDFVVVFVLRALDVNAGREDGAVGLSDPLGFDDSPVDDGGARLAEQGG